MKLIDRQIKAVEATLEQVIGEYESGRAFHYWDTDTCPLCLEFLSNVKERNNCGGSGCPFAMLEEHTHFPCQTFADKYCLKEHHRRELSFEDIAGFLKSLEISLKELRK